MDMKVSRSMISKKTVVLKNGLNVNLEFYQLPDIFSIYAIDQRNEIVGLLSFEIMRRFVCERHEEEYQKMSLMLGIPVSKLKEQDVIDVTQSDQDKYDIHGDFLIVDGQKYDLKQTVAFLDLIEIKDQDFFQVGLGSAMHKLMEKFAKANGCDEIRIPLYYPFGEFRSGTRTFYENVGYVFDTNGLKVTKHLDCKEQIAEGTPLLAPTVAFKCPDSETSHNSSKGTPINEKYFKEK